jgi:hypothetical protein
MDNISCDQGPYFSNNGNFEKWLIVWIGQTVFKWQTRNKLSMGTWGRTLDYNLLSSF